MGLSHWLELDFLFDLAYSLGLDIGCDLLCLDPLVWLGSSSLDSLELLVLLPGVGSFSLDWISNKYGSSGFTPLAQLVMVDWHG